MKSFTELKELVLGLEKDAERFYSKGNKAAGTRLRQGMQELKRKAGEIRAEVSALKHSATEEVA